MLAFTGQPLETAPRGISRPVAMESVHILYTVYNLTWTYFPRLVDIVGTSLDHSDMMS